MPRAPLQQGDQTYGGQAGSAGYQGSTGSKVLSGVGGVAAGLAAGASAGPAGVALGAAIGGLVGLVGDLVASGSGSKKPVAAKLKPQFTPREPTQVAGAGPQLSDPGSSGSPGFGPDVRLQAAKNLGRRFG